MKRMHYAPNKRRLLLSAPICGYMAAGDEICAMPDLVTCPDCLDWIKPNHDGMENSPASGGTEHG
jgi:hypothetical protein